MVGLTGLKMEKIRMLKMQLAQGEEMFRVRPSPELSRDLRGLRGRLRSLEVFK